MNSKTYIWGFLVVTLTTALLFKFSSKNTVGCDAFESANGEFMAYCDESSHGHYDHAAYLFNLEDGLADHVRQANLLFLGNSRLQYAFSNTSLTNFITKHPDVHPYLLGFGHEEQDVFSAAVLDKIKPNPRVIVINADPFFANGVSPHARQLLNESAMEEFNARIKKVWHRISEAACEGEIPLVGHTICGSHTAIYRSVQDGRWIWRNERLGIAPVGELPHSADDAAAVIAYATNAEAFLSRLAVDCRCVVLTSIPTGKGKPFIAQEIAVRLGIRFVAPRLDLLSTTDGSHLDTASSERWSKAFLSELEPTLTSCLH